MGERWVLRAMGRGKFISVHGSLMRVVVLPEVGYDLFSYQTFMYLGLREA